MRVDRVVEMDTGRVSPAVGDRRRIADDVAGISLAIVSASTSNVAVIDALIDGGGGVPPPRPKAGATRANARPTAERPAHPGGMLASTVAEPSRHNATDRRTTALDLITFMKPLERDDGER